MGLLLTALPFFSFFLFSFLLIFHFLFLFVCLFHLIFFHSVSGVPHFSSFLFAPDSISLSLRLVSPFFFSLLVSLGSLSFFFFLTLSFLTGFAYLLFPLCFFIFPFFLDLIFFFLFFHFDFFFSSSSTCFLPPFSSFFFYVARDDGGGWEAGARMIGSQSKNSILFFVYCFSPFPFSLLLLPWLSFCFSLHFLPLSPPVIFVCPRSFPPCFVSRRHFCLSLMISGAVLFLLSLSFSALCFLCFALFLSSSFALHLILLLFLSRSFRFEFSASVLFSFTPSSSSSAFL